MNTRDILNRSRYQSPERNMQMLLSVLTPSVIVPQPDKYYVFVYKAKTPNVRYDQHPFIVCTSVQPWGFTGYNFHWNQPRRYSWGEVKSNLYEVSDSELNDVEAIPFAKFKTS